MAAGRTLAEALRHGFRDAYKRCSEETQDRIDHPEKWAKRDAEVLRRREEEEARAIAPYLALIKTPEALALKEAVKGLSDENRVALKWWIIKGYCDLCGRDTSEHSCYCAPCFDI